MKCVTFNGDVVNIKCADPAPCVKMVELWQGILVGCAVML